MTQIQRHRSNKYVKMLDLFRQFYSKKDGFNQLFTSKSRLLAKKCQMLLYLRQYGILQKILPSNSRRNKTLSWDRRLLRRI